MFNTTRTHAHAVTATFTALEVPIPKKVAGATDRLADVTGRLRGLGPLEHDLANAVHAALAADRDPTTDPEVTSLVVAGAIANEGIAAAVTNLAESELRESLTGVVDEILAAWRPTFNQATSDLTAAWQALGGIDLADTGTIVQRGPEATATWAQAQKAINVIDATRNGTYALAELTRYAPQEVPLFRIAEATHTAWWDHDLGRRKPVPAWELVGIDGVSFDLADTDTVRERAASHRRREAEAARQAEGARNQALKLALRS